MERLHPHSIEALHAEFSFCIRAIVTMSEVTYNRTNEDYSVMPVGDIADHCSMECEGVGGWVGVGVGGIAIRHMRVSIWPI